MCPAHRSMFGVTSKIWTERGADGSYQSHYHIDSMQHDGILGLPHILFATDIQVHNIATRIIAIGHLSSAPELHNQPKLGDCVRFMLGFIWFRNNYFLCRCLLRWFIAHAYLPIHSLRLLLLRCCAPASCVAGEHSHRAENSIIRFANNLRGCVLCIVLQLNMCARVTSLGTLHFSPILVSVLSRLAHRHSVIVYTFDTD